MFGEICKKYNINLDDYEIDNGLEIKETIEKPIIKVEEDVELDTEYNNVNHLDFHNSYNKNHHQYIQEHLRVILDHHT